jgi:hypothetical protein
MELSDPEYLHEVKHNLEYMSWFAWYSSEDNWPQSSTEWMSSALETVDTVGFDFGAFGSWLESCTEVEQLLTPPELCSVEEVNNLASTIKDGRSYEVNGEVVAPLTKKNGSSNKRQTGDKKRPDSQKGRKETFKTAGKPARNQTGKYTGGKNVVSGTLPVVAGDSNQSTSKGKSHRGKRSKKAIDRRSGDKSGGGR